MLTQTKDMRQFPPLTIQTVARDDEGVGAGILAHSSQKRA